MRSKNKHLAVIILLFSMLSLNACRKDKEEVVDIDTTAPSENAMADAAFNDATNIADEASTGSLSSYRLGDNPRILTTCATITIDTVATPHLITINFGSSNCLCLDQNYRRGIIYVSFTGHYRDSASTHTITFSNYYVNDNNITGTKTVTNKGRNASGNLTFSISVNGAINWDAQYGGGSSTYSSSRTREWIAGENTPLWTDDVYLISGTSTGTTRNGNAYSLNTVTPLRKRIGFRHFTDGIVDLTPAGKATRRIDYGYIGGAEDALAQVTINGHTFTITLR